MFKQTPSSLTFNICLQELLSTVAARAPKQCRCGGRGRRPEWEWQIPRVWVQMGFIFWERCKTQTTHPPQTQPHETGSVGWEEAQFPRGWWRTGHVENVGGSAMRLFRSGPRQQVGVSPLGIIQDVAQCPAASPGTSVPSRDLTATFCSFSPNPDPSLRWAWSIDGSVRSPPA